jgi:flagellin-specific chaperone FliS
MTKTITQEEFKKEVEKLKKLIDILTENVKTPLLEVLG